MHVSRKLGLRKLVVLIFAVIGASACAQTEVQAQVPVAVGNAGMTRSVTWYDGGVRRTAWLSAELVMEFRDGSSEERVLRTVEPGARLIESRARAVHLWQVGSADKTLRSLSAVNPPNTPNTPNTATSGTTGRFSPVFHDAASAEGGKRALPGGIIVFFKSEWSDAEIRRWLAAKGHEADRKLNIAGNVYVVKTAPGLPALEAANAIHGSGEVLSAAPNWWQDRQLR